MLLFMPLALLFLFVVTDAGVMLAEKGAITDAVRAGLNVEGEWGPGKVRGISADEGVRTIVERVANEIAANVRRARTALPEGESFGIEVSAFSLDIAPETGALVSWSPEPRFTTAINQGGEAEDGAEARTSLSAALQSEKTRVPSRYALPVGLDYQAVQSAQNPSLRYQPQSLVLYAKVQAAASGINRTFTERVLGKAYDIAVREIRLVRRQY